MSKVKIKQHRNKQTNITVGVNMAIPASYIVDVSPRVISAGAAGIVINGLFLTTNP